METSQYKCPNCGAELVFDPSSQQLSCDFCRSSFTMEQFREITAEEDSQKDTAGEQEFESHTNLYTCSSCGAEIMADDNTTATFCYYCHSPVILSGRLTGSFKPDKVIGFKIEREQAVDAFKKWCSRKRFIPSDFKSNQQLEKITGLYVPFWVADCRMDAEFHGIGKQMRSWTSGNFRYTEIKEYSVDRSAKICTRGIPADGESKIEDLLMESIEPFDYAELQPFSMSYFSGFFADKYDVDRAGVFPRIRERAAQASREIVHGSISGYSSVTAHHESYEVDRMHWQYIMLPVWFMTYRYKGEVYEFAINGQTGKLAGTPPLDKKKLALFSCLIGLIFMIAGFLGGQLFI
ncbi:MAG: hypothetical protein K2J26_07500 [Ruminococcus sp.]|nr:hypothetical protein [Ruminococcus sp.]